MDLFSAFLRALTSRIVDINAKDLLHTLELLVQLAPAELWGESFHTSGLFAHLLKTLIAGEVSCAYLNVYVCNSLFIYLE